MKATTQDPILLMTLGTGKEVRCTEYDCGKAAVLGTFKPGFVAAWHAISTSAQDILEGHWDDGAAFILKQGSPDRAERKLGFASSSDDGKSMFCWSEVLKDIPLPILVPGAGWQQGGKADGVGLPIRDHVTLRGSRFTSRRSRLPDKGGLRLPRRI
jgi:hypothetical protein